MLLADETVMRMALEEAAQALAEGEIPVGAVLVCGEKIIARTHNLCATRTSATAHAEMLAIEAACQALGRRYLADCKLYVTLEPCPMCAGAAIHARIGEIVFAAADPRAGACGSLINLPAYPLEARPTVRGGLLAEKSLALLRAFFAEKRRGNPKSSALTFSDKVD